MTLIDRVAALLRERGVAHALIGAAALAAHGVARSTYDIDLLTTSDSVLEDGMWAALMAEGAAVEIRRGDDRDPLRGVVRVEFSSERPIDIVGRHAWQARAVERALRPAGALPVVRARDLVLLKLYAGGTQDLWDVRELLAGPGGSALLGEVSDDLEGLPGWMRTAWERLLGEYRERPSS